MRHDASDKAVVCSKTSKDRIWYIDIKSDEMPLACFQPTPQSLKLLTNKRLLMQTVDDEARTTTLVVKEFACDIERLTTCRNWQKTCD